MKLATDVSFRTFVLGALLIATATLLPASARAQVIFDGLPNAPLGSATVSTNGNKLVVSNIGSSGLDGVSVILPPQTISFDATWETMPLTDAVAGDIVFIDLFGTVGGGTGSGIGTLSQVVTLTGMDMSMTFAPVGAANQNIEVLRGGSVVHSDLRVDGDVVVVTPPPGPIVISEEGVDIICENGVNDTISVTFTVDHTFQVGPVGVQGDEIRFIRTSGLSVDKFERVDVRRSSLTGEDFEIASETPGFPPVMLSGGLLHSANGQATLSYPRETDFDLDRGLVVSNIGSSGLDGVTIDLGGPTDVMRMTVDFRSVRPDLLVHDYVVLLGGLPGQPGGSLTFQTGPLGGVLITPDFSPLGATGHTVELLDGPVVVHSGTNHPVEVTFPPGAEEVFSYTYDAAGRVIEITVPATAGSTHVPTKGENGGIIKLAAVGAPPFQHEQVTIAGENAPNGFTVSGVLLDRFSNPTIGLGTSQLNHSGGTLTVSNIGSSGCDGVSIDTGPAPIGQIDWLPLPPPPVSPSGAVLEFQVHNADASNENLVRMTNNPGTITPIEITPAFSRVASPTYTAVVLDAGTPVFQGAGLVGPVHNDNWPFGGSTSIQGLAFQYPPGTNFDIAGIPVVGDELRLLYATTGPLMPEGLDILIGGLPQMVVTNVFAAPPPQPQLYRGLLNSPLGIAQLTPAAGGDHLVVSNIGSSGCDGVSIDVGDIEGTGLVSEIDPAIVPPGGSVVFGAGNDETHTEFPESGLTVTRTGPGFSCGADFSRVGSSTYTVRLYGGGLLLHVETGVSGLSSVTFDVAPGAPMTTTFEYDDLGNILRLRDNSSSWSNVQVNGGPVIPNVALFECEPEVVVTDFGLSRVFIVGNDVPQLTLVDENAGMYQNEHRGRGQARLYGSGGHLTVSNIGSSGLDGVSIDPGHEFERLRVQINPLADPLTHIPTARLTWGTDYFGGLSSTVLMPITSHPVGGTAVDVIPDFSPLGASTHSVRILDNGIEVVRDSATVHLFTSSQYPYQFESSRDRVRLSFLTSTTMYLGNTAYVGDEVELIPNAVQSRDVLKAYFETGDIPTLRLVEEGGDRLVIDFEGYAHRAEGDAEITLSPSGDRLTVSNIGSSGCDGVSIDVAEVVVERFNVRQEFGPAQTPAGGTHRVEAFSTTSGPHGGAIYLRNAVGYVVVPDSPLYTARVLSGTNVLYSASGLSGPVVTMLTQAPAPATMVVEHTIDGTGGLHVVKCADATCAGFEAGGVTYAGDRLEIIEESPGPPVTLARVLTLYRNTSVVATLDESVEIFDVFASAEGESQLSRSGGNLVVSNIGSSGQDGVRFIAPPGGVENMNAHMLPVTFQTSDILRAEVDGLVGGLNQSLGTLELQGVPGPGFTTVLYTPDFTNIGSSTHRVQILDGGVLVADLPGQSGSVVSTPTPPDKIGKLGGGTECFVSCYPPGTQFDVGGIPHVGDELRLLAEAPIVIDTKSSMVLLATMPFTIIDFDFGLTSQQALFEGLDHLTLGQARLETSGGTLTVSNIGSSGKDGVSIDVGETEGFLVQQEFAQTGGTQYAYDALGRIASVPGQQLGHLDAVLSGNTYDLIPNFLGVGSTTYGVRLFDNGVLVQQSTGHSGALVGLDVQLTPGLVEIGYDGNGGAMYVQCISPLCGGFLIGGAPVTGDRVEFHPDSPPALPTVVELFEVGALNVSSFTLTDEALGLFGVLNSAEGTPRLQASGGQLTVSNIGSSGQDGVRQVMPPGGVESVNTHFAPDMFGSPLTVGGSLTVSAGGELNAVPDQPLGTLVMEAVAGALGSPVVRLTPDFSPLGSPTHRVQVFDGGVLVHDVSGHSGVAAEASSSPIKIGKLGGGTECFVSCHPVGTTFTVDGAPFIGDEVRVLAETSNVVGAKDHIAYLPIDLIPSVVILDTDFVLPARPLFHDGLLHTPLGQARLDPSGDRLVVSNIGSSGKDGVSIDVGETGGFVSEFIFDPSLPQLQSWHWNAIGDQPGAPGISTIVFDLQEDATGLSVGPTFHPAIPGSYVFRLYDRGTLVTEIPSLIGPAVHLDFPAGPPGAEPFQLELNWDIYLAIFRFPATYVSVTVGGQTFSGDLMTFRCEDPDPPAVGQVVRIFPFDQPDAELSEEHIRVFDLNNSANGGARLDPAGGRLVVSNIGSSGCDGVSIDLGESEFAEIEWEPLPPQPPLGSSIWAQVTGTVGAGPPQALGEFHAELIPGPISPLVEYVVDFSSLGSSTYRLQVLDQGALVLDLPGQSGPVGTTSVWPIKVGKLGGATECYVACHPLGTVYDVGGGQHVGNELRILAEGPPGGTIIKQRFDLNFRHIPDVTIVRESVERPGPPVDVPQQVEIPLHFSLERIWPNPSQGSSTLRFGVPAAGRVTMKVYDVSGRVVRTMLNGEIEPGMHAVTWNRRTDGNRIAAPGLYFVRGKFDNAGGGTETLRGRIVVVK